MSEVQNGTTTSSRGGFKEEKKCSFYYRRGKCHRTNKFRSHVLKKSLGEKLLGFPEQGGPGSRKPDKSKGQCAGI